MAVLNLARKEIVGKIVYYGPGLCGKTTNLVQLHQCLPQEAVGALQEIATETDRTLFCDFMPVNLGEIAGMTVKFQMYTVPGQAFYKATRQLVLQGADGVVFVADSQRSKMDENLKSLEDLRDNLRMDDKSLETMPLVFQWNKRDLPEVTPTEELEARLNPGGLPAFDAVAVEGQGVAATLKGIAILVVDRIQRKYAGQGPAGSGPGQALELARQLANQTRAPRTPPPAPKPAIPSLPRRTGAPAPATPPAAPAPTAPGSAPKPAELPLWARVDPPR